MNCSATITNKSEQENLYSYWLTASQNGGVEYPLSETKTISVASGAVVTTVDYRFRPKNIPGSGEWQLILNMQNETENEAHISVLLLLSSSNYGIWSLFETH